MERIIRVFWEDHKFLGPVWVGSGALGSGDSEAPGSVSAPSGSGLMEVQ